METASELRKTFDEYKKLGLKLNIQRGQPGDDNFDVSNGLFSVLNEKDNLMPSGVDIRNYPGGIAGLKEAREVFSPVLGVRPEEMVVGNSSSLRMLANTLMWALIRGLKNSPAPWAGTRPKMIVTLPGYDRHFTLLDGLGFEMVTVNMTGDGPDLDAVEKIAGSDPAVKGILFVPTYSNPTGEKISDAKVRRLAAMKTAAPDFTIFADDAYAVHHLTEDKTVPANLLRACEAAGNPDRVYIYGSTSKITFSSAGIGFFGTSEANLKYITGLMNCEFIGPNKVEQYRHVLFIRKYPGGIPGIMAEHARLLAPKFRAVQEVLARELGGTGLAEWTDPKGGYFVSLTTARPVAKRVVELANELGVSLTPAGATYPFGKDPGDSNIRIAPTRPPVKDVEKAMEILCLCVKLASAELDK